MANPNYNPIMAPQSGWNTNGYFYPPVNAQPYMYPQQAGMPMNAPQYGQPSAQPTQTQNAPTGQSTPSQTGNTQFAFISGVENAKNYLQLSQSAFLYDDDAGIVYMKKNDENNKSIVKCFALKEIEMPKTVTSADTSKFVTNEKFDAFAEEIKGYIKMFAPKLTKTTKITAPVDPVENVVIKED